MTLELKSYSIKSGGAQKCDASHLKLAVWHQVYKLNNNEEGSTKMGRVKSSLSLELTRFIQQKFNLFCAVYFQLSVFSVYIMNLLIKFFIYY